MTVHVQCVRLSLDSELDRTPPRLTYKYEAPVLRLAQVLPVDISPFAGQTGDIWNRVKQVLLAGAYLEWRIA